MKVKRIYAVDTRSGMQKVKQELGLEAVILANKKVAGGVEILAAIDFDEAAIEKMPLENQQEPTQTSVLAKHLHPAMQSPENVVHLKQRQHTLQQQKDEMLVRRLQKSSGLIKKQKEIIEKQQLMLKKISHTQRREPVIKTVRDELRQLKNIVLGQFENIGWNKWMEQAPEQLELFKRLTKIGLNPKFSRSIVDKIDSTLTRDAAWRMALGLWSRELSVTRDDILTHGGIITLLGPTGVGKTTTAAKLAATHAQQHGSRDVCLISCDQSRAGAYDQLMIYGRMFGIRVLSASDEIELRDILDGLKNKKLIIIDTAGISLRDERLKIQLSNFRRDFQDAKHYLVLSANTQESCLLDTIQAYRQVPLSGCILTKLDEASSLGNALTVAALNKLPFAYVTNGQSIPEDIQPAHIHRLISKAVALATARKEEIEDSTLVMQSMRMAANT